MIIKKINDQLDGDLAQLLLVLFAVLFLIKPWGLPVWVIAVIPVILMLFRLRGDKVFYLLSNSLLSYFLFIVFYLLERLIR